MAATEHNDRAWVELGRGRRVWVDELPAPLFACARLMDFMNMIGQQLIIDTTFQQIVVGTVKRSFDTFTSICGILYDEKPIQAAMLCRPLFEDVVVMHWLLYNDSDPAWLVEKFERHREAIALYQEQVAKKTEWATGPPLIADTSRLKARQNELVKEFGGEAQKNWWDPGSEGEGKGKPIGLRGVAEILEDVAADRRRFDPRFAGGDEPVLRRMELVISKWFSQSIHHTAIGLPIDIPGHDNPPTEGPNRSYLVAFSAFWLSAQQLYGLHELYGRPAPELDHLMYDGLTEGFGAPPETLHMPDQSGT
jgi:hypothetical protein